jgi:hypothetical protein
MPTYVAVFALLLSYVALVAAFLALRTLAKLRRATALLRRGPGDESAHESLIEATGRQAELTASLSEQVAALRQHVEQTRLEAPAGPTEQDAVARGGLRNVALVRYDAFAEMSGRMSFSLALLDEHGDGVAISAIAGQTDTRVYAKGVTAGKGEHELSPEESQAVASALDKRTGPARRAS